ncbi:hypothetical protein SCHPADRAFT_669981 [Schizopora paradoxa]|uniref:Uncharacterized protein n=1 Tax=Schizopora paradoxa TaxID=27342 RepID=A0A0H2R6M6_9AGAM|nr:hypothetical protein SCHPADRAFT_669981 [Schizopora paradoxa]
MKTSSVSLKQMEDALILLTSLWESLDDTIQEAYDNNSRSAGLNLALLPEDVLVRIFEMYIEMCVMPDYDHYEVELRSPDVSPQIISLVCRRFREIVLHLPSAWQHISLNFPPHILCLHKERCSNPTLHISPTKNVPQMFAKMHIVIHPYYQWRELRMTFEHENYTRWYFKLLKPIIQTPFHALEFLSISNKLKPTESRGWNSPCLERKNANFLSSWRMPNLTHLELRNVLPMKPLQCENVTFLHLDIIPNAVERKLCTRDFQAFLQSMPKIQSLSAIIKIVYVFFDEDSLIEEPHSTLPILTALALQVVGPVPRIDKALGSFMALIDTRKLTRFSFGVNSGGEPRNPQAVPEDCLLTIFPTQSSDPQLGLPFERLEHFSIEMVDHRGAIPFDVFGRIFTLMPNVRHVSLTLPPTFEHCDFRYLVARQLGRCTETSAHSTG